MKTLWVDASNGAAGDMLLAALLDAGADLGAVRAGLRGIDVEPVGVTLNAVRRHGLRAAQVVVAAPDSETTRNLSDVVSVVSRAGLHRLLAQAGRIAAADAVVAVAGMEAALPSVLGGLVGVPLIAVPTSVGYGWNLDGVSAWLACVNSCAPGVLTVNVDNGFGAGVAAARIARAAAGAQPRPPQADGEAR